MQAQKIFNPFHSELIAVDDGFEVKYLQQRLGVSRGDVIRAISVVGNGRREVVAYLERLKRERDTGVS
jgi:hypothetical protein